MSGERGEAAVPEAPHIVKSFSQELQRLRDLLTQMGGIVESQLALATQAIVNQDADTATRAVQQDPAVDSLERQVEQTVIRMLALRQPMANDLRQIVAALKTSAGLERIGDYAKNVAKRSIVLGQFAMPFSLTGLGTMARLAQENLRLVIDAVSENDPDKAVQVWQSDQAIDDLYNTMLRYNLEKQGFRVEEAVDGQEAMARIAESPPDIVLLDWMLPVMSGIEVCRQIRRRPATRDLPVIMVTARTEDQDAVRGLNTGADDYITKPFNMDALLARMRALLRRSGAAPVRGKLEFLDLVMDLAAHRVSRNNRTVHLGPTEYRLLEFLMQHPRRVFSREELLNAVWGRDIHVEPRTVDVHIRRLRKSINADGEVDVVRTVRAAGYALDTDPV
jgi:two-component system phosphate regulon response regulator PhoB